MTSRRRFHGEQGASLVLALVFLMIFSLVSVSTLGLAGAGFRTTTVTDDRSDRLYAADGGIEWGVERLSDPSACPEVTDGFHSGLGSFTTEINGQVVTVECQTTAVDEHTEPGSGGASPLLGGYTAILGHDNQGGLSISGSTNHPPTFLFRGTVYSQGTVSVEDTTLELDGNLELRTQPCPPANLTFTEGTAFGCTSGVPIPPIPDPMPTVAIPGPAPEPWTAQGTKCTVLYPGKYGRDGQGVPNFNSNSSYYLASGTYYFNGVGSLNLRGEIVGGAMASTDVRHLPNPPCASDADATAARPGFIPVGTGVTIILGGNSTLEVQSGANAEFFTREGSETGTTPGLAVWARRDTQGTSGGTYEKRDNGDAVKFQNKKSNAVLHGLTYVPELDITLDKEPLNEDANGVAIFTGGVLARSLMVRIEGNNSDNPIVTLAGTEGGVPVTYTTPRTTVIQATVPGTNTIITAVVDRTTSPPTISSWRMM